MKKYVTKLNRGSSTLEILIAFTLLTITLSTVVLVIFDNQSLYTDIENNSEALYKTIKTIEDVKVKSKNNFLAAISTSSQEVSSGIVFLKELNVIDISLCKKQVGATTEWTTMKAKPQTIEMVTILSDIITAIGLGGDCASQTPKSDWKNPAKYASATISPGNPTSLDELNKVVYIGSDKPPFIHIASTTHATKNQNSNILETYTNNFDLKNAPNSIDAVRYFSLNKIYLFSAISSSTKQLAIIDVTEPKKPSVIYKGLSQCVSGSYPQGWLTYFYKNTLYLTTRYTAGPEFHIFDVTDPLNPIEYPLTSSNCRGLELGDSVNDIVVQDQIVDGAVKRFAYLATDEIDKELRVFDVTNPLSVKEVLQANQNLPGSQNGMSLFSIGNKLFLGRQSAPTGPDLYIYDTSNPITGLTLIKSVDIGTGIYSMRVAGKYLFISTPKSNQELQVWNIENTSNITNIAKYNSGNIALRGIDFNSDFIYATGQSLANFQIIHTP